jgi:MFS family permease
MQNRSIRKNNGFFHLEDRLWGMYVSSPLMTLGLCLVGFALNQHWHWFAIAFNWGLFVFAAMTSTVVISTYVLDCFPRETAIAAALLNFTRVLFGFVVPIFQKSWSDAIGAQWSFTLQGLVCLCALPLVAVIQREGKKWRQGSRMGPTAIRARQVHHGNV